jgi:hypothetical protein
MLYCILNSFDKISAVFWITWKGGAISWTLSQAGAVLWIPPTVIRFWTPSSSAALGNSTAQIQTETLEDPVG